MRIVANYLINLGTIVSVAAILIKLKPESLTAKRVALDSRLQPYLPRLYEESYLKGKSQAKVTLYFRHIKAS